MSGLSESGGLTKRDMQNMQGGARGLELRTADLKYVYTAEGLSSQKMKTV